MDDLSNLISGLVYFTGTIVLIQILVWVITIYMIITAWLNIKHTRVNTDKIVQLLTAMHNRNTCESPGLDTQDETNINSTEHANNESIIDESIKGYEGWWVKLNPPSRQPLPKNMNFDGTPTKPAETVNNPSENGDKIETDLDIIPKEKWWNKKIF